MKAGIIHKSNVFIKLNVCAPTELVHLVLLKCIHICIISGVPLFVTYLPDYFSISISHLNGINAYLTGVETYLLGDSPPQKRGNADLSPGLQRFYRNLKNLRLLFVCPAARIAQTSKQPKKLDNEVKSGKRDFETWQIPYGRRR